MWGRVNRTGIRIDLQAAPELGFSKVKFNFYLEMALKLATSNSSTCFHEDVFYEYFRPFRHPAAQFDIWGGHGLETYGSDLQLVREYDQRHVWTVVDGDVDQWIVPGLRYVNRICYLLTERPHSGAGIEFRIARSGQSLTKIGLTRRISTLCCVLARRS